MKLNSLFLLLIFFTTSLFASEKTVDPLAMVTTHRAMLHARDIIKTQREQKRHLLRARLQQAVKCTMRSAIEQRKFEAQKYALNRTHAKFHETQIALFQKKTQADQDHYLRIVDDQRQRIDALSCDYAKMRVELAEYKARLASLTTALEAAQQQEADALQLANKSGLALATFKQELDAIEPLFKSTDMKKQHEDIVDAIDYGIWNVFYKDGSDTDIEN